MVYTVKEVAVLSGGSGDVQTIIRRHFEWLKQFWTPNRESYSGHGDLILDSDLRKAYEAHDPKLPAIRLRCDEGLRSGSTGMTRITNGCFYASRW